MKRQLCFGISIVMLAGAKAGAESPAFSVDDLFHCGTREAVLDTGVLFSPALPDPGRPTENYTVTDLQLGWMLTDVKGGALRGNFELAADVFGGGVFDGDGSYAAGATLWIRYNFVPASWRLVPFVQLGGGAGATDMSSKLVGQTFTFNLDAGGGVRWFVAPNWSVNFEFRYQHLSNGRLAPHDLGVNAIGPTLGVSYFF